MVLDYLFIGALSAWFLLTIIYQFEPLWFRKYSTYDYLKLLPRWTFFAPNPGSHDYRLIYRDLFSDHASEWHELGVPGRGKLSPLWNPNKKRSKVLSDSVQAIAITQPEIPDFAATLPFQLYYLVLLNYVLRAGPDTKPQLRQFALVQTHGFDGERQMEVIMISNRHRVAESL